MTIHKERKTKKYKIEKLLGEIRGGKTELARELGIKISGVYHSFNRGIKTVGTQKKYTEAFNKCFEVNYSYKELFSLEE